MRAKRMWISAVWRSGSLAAMRSPKAFQAAHLRLDPTAGVVACPVFPERPSVISGGAQGVVSGACSRAVFFPKTSVPADGDDRGALPVGDGLVAPARVIGAVGGDRADLLVRRDLAQQVRKHGAVHCPAVVCEAEPREGPSRLGVNSTARMSAVAGSMARCTLRHWRRPCTPCLRACHSPSPRNLMPVLSTSRFSGPSARR